MLFCLLFYTSWIIKGPVTVDLTWVSRAGQLLALRHNDASWTLMRQRSETLNISVTQVVVRGARSLVHALLDSTSFRYAPLPACLVLIAVLLLTSAWLLITVSTRGTPEKPTLYYKASPLNVSVIKKCRLQDRHFRPRHWLGSRHAQTLLPYVLARSDVMFEREYLQMSDKGVVALDWAAPHGIRMKRKAPVLLIIPPITEGAGYVSGICAAGTERGFNVLVFNRRGHGGSYLTTPKLKSLCDPSDLKQAIDYIKLKLTKCPLSIVAYGTGCGLLMSFLGNSDFSSTLSAAVCISPYYKPLSQMAFRPSRVYDFLFLLKLKAVVFRHAKALSSVLNIDKVMASWTFSEFQDSVFAPFYNCSGPVQLGRTDEVALDGDFNSLQVPLLCINSLDDPVYACAEIPYSLFKSSPSLLLAVTNQGGHCGFQQDFPAMSWSESLSLDYVEAVGEFRAGQTVSCPLKQNSRCRCPKKTSTVRLNEIGRKHVNSRSHLTTIHEN